MFRSNLFYDFRPENENIKRTTAVAVAFPRISLEFIEGKHFNVYSWCFREMKPETFMSRAALALSDVYILYWKQIKYLCLSHCKRVRVRKDTWSAGEFVSYFSTIFLLSSPVSCISILNRPATKAVFILVERRSFNKWIHRYVRH